MSKILHVIPSVNPESGGPIEAVIQLSLVHLQLGHTSHICSLDNPDNLKHSNNNLTVYALGPGYLSYGYCKNLSKWLNENISNYDAVIIHGLWQYCGFATRKIALKKQIPYYIFPHGMLDPWFKYKYPFKHIKKWLYWPWGEYKVLRDARRVIFTCELEEALAKKSFSYYRVNSIISSLGTTATGLSGGYLKANFLKNRPSLIGKKLILFLSRIHEKKGCDILIQAFSKVSHLDPSLHLLIAGPENQYGLLNKLNKLAQSLGVGNKISWLGMLNGDDKWGAYYASDIFCLPSHQENFGIVVIESLATGTPVIISNKINIWREINSCNAGFINNDTLEGTVLSLKAWLNTSNLNFDKMKSNAELCFKNNFEIENSAKKLIQIMEL
jgi:glycosyltransferase involved in cell wall biosynthesis